MTRGSADSFHSLHRCIALQGPERGCVCDATNRVTWPIAAAPDGPPPTTAAGVPKLSSIPAAATTRADELRKAHGIKAIAIVADVTDREAMSSAASGASIERRVEHSTVRAEERSRPTRDRCRLPEAKCRCNGRSEDYRAHGGVGARLASSVHAREFRRKPEAWLPL